MTILLPPPPDTPVARRAPDDLFLSPGRWHFMRGDQKTVCGQILSGLHPVIKAHLGDPQVKAKDMCRECWPWSGDDTFQLELKLEAA